jgi:Domain of unknown function (DUF222)
MSIASQPVPAPSHPFADLDRLGDEIAELSAHLDAATARLLTLIREFDARGGWNSGFSSCAAWLGWRVGLDLGAARERVRVARALGSLPRLAEALACGELSYAKVRALTRVATPATEARLLAVGRAGTAAHIERIVRGWRRVGRQAEVRQAARRHAERGLHVYQDDDGTVLVRGRLTPEVGALLIRALDAARETLYQRMRVTSGTAASDPAIAPPTRAQQQADALALLAETALHHEIDPGAPGERYQVVVHVDAAVLADPEQPGKSVLEEGGHVSAETSRRLACDASRVSCGTTTRGAYSRSGPGRGRFRRRCDARCSIGTGAVASRAATYGSDRATTFVTGPGAALPRSATSSCYAAAITTRYTKRVIGSLEDRTARSTSVGRMAGRYRRCRRPPRCPWIRFIRCTRSMRRWDFGSTRERRAPGG